jgi:hypothetical protein
MNQYLVLILLIIVPFLVINGSLFPYSSGIHGTTHAVAGNDYVFDGEIEGDTPILFNRSNFNRINNITYDGHFKGDVFIDDNTGWVFCNGKVRFSGKLHIKNAEFDYHIKEEYHSLCFTVYDFQRIEMNGDSGEMQEGFPFFILGLLGSCVGIVGWCAWFISSRNEKIGNVVLLSSSFFVLFALSLEDMISFICCICPTLIIFFVIIILLVALTGSKDKINKWRIITNNVVILRIIILFGAVLVIFFTASIINPNYHGEAFMIGGSYYSETHAMASLYSGIIGTLSCAGLMGSGIGRLIKLAKMK